MIYVFYIIKIKLLDIIYFMHLLYISHLSEGKVKITPTFVDELNAVLTKYQQDTVTSDYDDHLELEKLSR